MPTHRSREAPIPGASVSERHHGFWKDLVERERHIRERWEVTYGGFYHQKPCSEEPYYGPIFASIPAIREVNYLPENDAPKSEPMAYLRACLRKQEAATKTIAPEGTDRKCEGMLQKYVPGKYVHDKVICTDLLHKPLKDSVVPKFKPSAAIKNKPEEPYYGPIYTSVPPMRELNYLPENDAPKSEPMAHLRSCLRKQEAATKTIAAEGTDRKCEGMLQKYVPGKYVHDKIICTDLKDSEFQKFKPVAAKNQEYLDATFTKKLSLPSFSCQAVKLQPNNYLDIQKSTADCKATFEQYQMPPNLVKLAQGKDEVLSHSYKMSSAVYNCAQHTSLPRLSERTLCWPVQTEFPEYCLEHCGSLCGPVACSTVRTAISNFSGLGVYPYILQRSVEDKPKTPNGQLRMHP